MRKATVVAVVAALLFVVSGAQPGHDSIHAACLVKLAAIESAWHSSGTRQQRLNRIHTELHRTTLCESEPTPEPVPLGTNLPAKLPRSSGTATIFVAPTTGSNANSGLDIAHPKKTLAAAFALAQVGPGAIIYLRGNDGVHGANGPSGEATSVTAFLTKFGSVADPITIQTYPGDPMAVIDGTRFHFNPGDMKQQDYNSGNGFNLIIGGSAAGGIEFKNGSGTGASGNEAIKSNNPRNMEISYNVFHDTQASAIIIRGMGREQQLAGAIDASQTTITVDATTNLLNATPYYLGLTNVTGAGQDWDAVTEVVRVTNVAGTTLTVERGAKGTGADPHVNLARVMGHWQADNVQIFSNKIYNAGGERDTVNGNQSLSTGGTLVVNSTARFAASGAVAIDGLPVNVSIPYTSILNSTTLQLGAFAGGPYSVSNGAVVVDNWAASHSHGIYYGSDVGATGGAIYNNLVYDAASVGITLHENAEGCIVSNNTIDGSGRGGINLSGEKTHGTMDCVVKNNIATNTKQRAPSNGVNQSGYAFNVWYESTIGQWADYLTAGNVVDKNIYFGNAGADNSGYHTNHAGSWPGSTVVSFTNDVGSNPLYINAAVKNFGLSAGSPAINFGDETYCPTFDFYGSERSQCDSGAIRYTAPPGGSVTPSYGRGRTERRKRGDNRILVGVG